MKQKFVFRTNKPKEYSNKSQFVLKKVDVDAVVPKAVPKSEVELKLEAMEKELVDLQKKEFQEKNQPNLKPQKMPSTKRTIKGDVVMFDRWAPIVTAWAKDKPVQVDTKVGRTSDRVDIMNEDIRIVVMASYDSEFTITLFYNYDSGFNSRRINVEYIKIGNIQTALDFVFDGKSLFNFKENEDVNTADRQRQ